MPNQPHVPMTDTLRRAAADSLEVVLHLAQLGHDGDGVRLAGSLLDLRVLSLLSAAAEITAREDILPEAS